MSKSKNKRAQGLNGLLPLVTSIGVIILVLIFVGVLGGQTYQQTEANIQAINDTTIKDSITTGIQSSFSALGTTGEYLPLIVLAVMISIILGLVLSMTFISGGNKGSGGTAL